MQRKLIEKEIANEMLLRWLLMGQKFLHPYNDNYDPDKIYFNII